MNDRGSTAGRRAAPRAGIVPKSIATRAAWAATVALALAALATPAMAAGAAAGAPRGGAALPDPSPVARRVDGRQMSLDEAVDAAQRRYNARVVRAEVEERGGRRVYVLRLLSSDGRVFNVRVDAASGSMQ